MADNKTQPSSATEQRYWRQLQEGSMDALGFLYDMHVDTLFAVGTKINSDRQVVQDGIHDLFLDLYKYHKKLAAVQHIAGYLIVALKRKLYKLGDTKVRNISIGNEDALHLSKNNTGFVNSCEDEIIFQENSQEHSIRLNRVLEELSDHQQEILRLRFEEEKTYEQIASDMNVSVSSARTLLYRTLKHARKVALSFF